MDFLHLFESSVVWRVAKNTIVATSRCVCATNRENPKTLGASKSPPPRGRKTVLVFLLPLLRAITLELGRLCNAECAISVFVLATKWIHCLQGLETAWRVVRRLVHVPSHPHKGF